jgi:hypothetical protein
MVNVLFLIEHGKTEQTLRMNKTSTTIKVERKSLTVQTIRMSSQQVVNMYGRLVTFPFHSINYVTLLLV